MGGRDGGRDAHFFAPFVGLVDAELALLGSEMSHCATAMSGSVALIFHIDGPSSSRRQADAIEDGIAEGRLADRVGSLQSRRSCIAIEWYSTGSSLCSLRPNRPR